MLNTDTVPSPDALTVIDYVDPVVKQNMAAGQMNTAEPQILAHILASIRRGHPQWRGGPMRSERICLVGSGPSLDSTIDELRQLIWEGASLVTLNAGYHWCIQHGFKPTTQIVMDARPSNARFLEPAVPKCNYVLASQCAPQVWDAVEGRPHVWIFHAVVKQEGPTSQLLDDYYQQQWIGVSGGTTVATRALTLLRIAGYIKFSLFGIDCCWMGDTHHALPQPENVKDKFFKLTVGVNGHPETDRTFKVSPWHAKQMEDSLVVFKLNGKLFQVNVHGDGMLAHVMQALGTVDDLSAIRMSASED